MLRKEDIDLGKSKTSLKRFTEGDKNQDGNLEGKKFVCPVCGGFLHEKNLPDMESIIYDNLYDQGGVRIGSPKVRLHCDFEHCFDEEGLTMDNPHDLVAFIDAEFDQAGDCTKFVLSGVHPAKKESEV